MFFFFFSARKKTQWGFCRSLAPWGSRLWGPDCQAQGTGQRAPGRQAAGAALGWGTGCCHPRRASGHPDHSVAGCLSRGLRAPEGARRPRPLGPEQVVVPMRVGSRASLGQGSWALLPAGFSGAPWVGTHGEAGLGTAGGAGVRARGAPDTEVGLGGVEGGRACRGPMRAQGVKASVAGQRARARRQSPGGRQEWPRQASLRTGSLASGSVPAGRGAGFGSVLAARARGAGARSRPGKGGVGTFSRSPPRAGVGAPGSPEPLCSRTGRGEGLGPPA